MDPLINRRLAKSERREERFPTALPIEMSGIPGVAKNISASGVYFEAMATHEVGSKVHFTVEVHVNGEKQMMVCDGFVVRVDQKDGVLGIAAKLEGSFFSDNSDEVDPDMDESDDAETLFSELAD